MVSHPDPNMDATIRANLYKSYQNQIREFPSGWGCFNCNAAFKLGSGNVVGGHKKGMGNVVGGRKRGAAIAPSNKLSKYPGSYAYGYNAYDSPPQFFNLPSSVGREYINGNAILSNKIKSAGNMEKPDLIDKWYKLLSELLPAGYTIYQVGKKFHDLYKGSGAGDFLKELERIGEFDYYKGYKPGKNYGQGARQSNWILDLPQSRDPIRNDLQMLGEHEFY